MTNLRLLIITQKVDAKDPILGFFIRWIEECAKRVSTLTVFGQSVSATDLPPNVTVRSLGKEEGKATVLQILRFWKLAFQSRKDYDAVLVHMTPVWVVLGWPLWVLLRKRVYLWYEVRRGGTMLKLAVWMSRQVFSATEDGVPFSAPNISVVGHGIDIARFTPSAADRDVHLVSTVGRITTIKHLEYIVDAFAALPHDYKLIIAGPTITSNDHETLAMLKKRIADHNAGDRVSFTVLDQDEVASLLRRSMLFLHAAGGGLDKVVLEAMASGCLVASASEAAKRVLPEVCVGPRETLGVVAGYLLHMPPHDQEDLRHRLRTTIEQQHSLPTLMDRLVAGML